MDFIVGDCRLTAVVELDRLGYPVEMFDGDGRALLQRDMAWLAPDFYDASVDQLLLSHHSWLLDTGARKVLIDPCIGNGKSRTALPDYHLLDVPWLERLAAAGVAPEEIDVVVCTHLHPDHCGWNTRLVDGRWVPTFPNAVHVMSRAERDHWAVELRGEPLAAEEVFNAGVFADSVQPVIEAGLAMVVDGEAEVAGCLRIEPAPGHTVGHLCAVLSSAGDGAVFAGDALHHPLQMIDPDLDLRGCCDVAEARRSRRRILDLCADNGYLLAPAHFRGSRAVRIERCGTGFAVTGTGG